jgi:hypothetical protein
MKKFNFLILMVLISCHLFAIRPDSTYLVTPNHYGLKYRECDFYTEDSVRLVGWLIPAQKKVELDSMQLPAFYNNPINNQYNICDYLPKPTIIICDGDGGNMSYTIWMANEFVGYGFNVFMFDWRGFGKSQGWEIDERLLVLPEFLKDYQAAINFVTLLPEVDSDRICLYGFSTGFYLSFAMAVTNKNVKCIAGRGLITTAKDLKDCLSTVKDTTQIIIPSNYPENLYPLNCATELTVPIFIIVGENDERTPVWMSEMVFSKIQSKKVLVVYPQEDHCSIEVNLRLSVFKEIANFFMVCLDQKQVD